MPAVIEKIVADAMRGLVAPAPNPAPERSPMAQVADAAAAVIAMAEQRGMVLAIEQRPRLPLAMGNYETVAHVRLGRQACKEELPRLELDREGP